MGVRPRWLRPPRSRNRSMTPTKARSRSLNRAPPRSAVGAGGDDVSYVEIEVRAKSVDLAVEAAMQELGVADRDQLSVEVIQEPERGFLGLGGQDAVVRVKRRKGR